MTPLKSLYALKPLKSEKKSGIQTHINRAATHEYLTLDEAFFLLQEFKIPITAALFFRYILEEKIAIYGWLNKAISTYEVQSNQKTWIKAGFYKASHVDFYITDATDATDATEPSSFIFQDKKVILKANCLSAFSEIVCTETGQYEQKNWFYDLEDYFIPFVSSQELLSLSYYLKQQIETIQALIPADTKHRPESEATPQSAYIVIGALLDLLTSQTTPRRNQSSIKTELEGTGLKGLSKGSLDATFAKANKAIEQAKAQK